MIFQRRYDRARELQKEKLGEAVPALEREDISQQLEKHDTFALIVSGLITIVPAVLIALLVIVGIGYFFIVR